MVNPLRIFFSYSQSSCDSILFTKFARGYLQNTTQGEPITALAISNKAKLDIFSWVHSICEPIWFFAWRWPFPRTAYFAALVEWTITTVFPNVNLRQFLRCCVQHFWFAHVEWCDNNNQLSAFVRHFQRLQFSASFAYIYINEGISLSYKQLMNIALQVTIGNRNSLKVKFNLQVLRQNHVSLM